MESGFSVSTNLIPDGTGPVTGLLGMVSPATPSSAPTVLAEQLRKAILASAPPLGTKLFTLSELTRRTGHSASVVREAIQQLNGEGIIEVRQGNRGGVYTRRVADDALLRPLQGLIMSNQITNATVIEARQQLESACARLASERRDPDKLEALRASIDRMKSLTHAPAEFTSEGARFHMLIGQASCNDVLIAINASLRDLFHHDYLKVPYNEEDLQHSVRAHQRIYNHIAAGDADGAHRTIIQHLEGFVEATDRTLSSDGLAVK